MLVEKGPPQIRFFTVLALCLFTLLVVRLGYLQVAKGSQMAALARRSSLRLARITAPRGIFYDRNHVPLVTSRLAFSLVAMPEAMTDPAAELARLAKILHVPVDELRKKLAKSGRAEQEGITLASNLDHAATLKLGESDLPGIMLQEMPVRYYPRGEFASHLFGYVGEISAEELGKRKDQGYRTGQIVGQTGLEKVYDRILQGTDGGRLMEVDHLGVPRKTVGYRESVAGEGLELTIDAKLQQTAEKALAEQLKNLQKGPAPAAKAGAVLALDPRTGEILAMTSQPGFDPNLFVGGISAKDYNRLARDTRDPFTNRVVAGEFPAGSTFKPVTGIAALSEGRVTLADRFYCSGRDPVYPKKKCWTLRGHGLEDIIAGFKNSCNIVFYELGRRVGPDKLAEYARLFGLGQLTGIELPGERKGLVPDTTWKQRVYKERWYMPETMDFAIGQGFLNMTPIQLGQVYMALANGGTIYRPMLVRKILNPDGSLNEVLRPQVSRRIPLDQDALEIVDRGLEAVTGEGGTAHAAFVGLPVKVAGKSGTAQNSQGPSHGWFAGMAPAGDPKIVVIVLVEHGTSGAMAAAPVARKVFDAFFGVKPADRPTPTAAQAPAD